MYFDWISLKFVPNGAIDNKRTAGWGNIMKTHVRGFFDTDLHEVSWHFATHEAVRPSGF